MLSTNFKNFYEFSMESMYLYGTGTHVCWLRLKQISIPLSYIEGSVSKYFTKKFTERAFDQNLTIKPK